jgi:beta-N-acetylhexosaminidase
MKIFFLLTLILLIFFPFVSSIEEINLSEMSLDEKIGQLMLIRPTNLNLDYINELHIGGIFLSKQTTKEEYKEFVEFYKNNSKIELFVAADMEGYWNPFEEFYDSRNFGEINSSNESYNLGKEQGRILQELGFNLDFSPVVEIRNNVWPGRSFVGTEEEISKKIANYIQGLHSENIFATAKHYPGGNLVKNSHIIKYKINATKQELEMFQIAIENDVDFIMVGHPIIYGELDSNKKQATISSEIISGLRENFQGIIITDAVTMLGLRISYLFNFKKVYPDLILAGNDIILDTHTNSNYKRLLKRRNELKKAVLNGKISEMRIDESVKRILEKKGYTIL